MRDPERITQILNELESYWKKHPDLRLSQIVSNCHSRLYPLNNDVFYFEDRDLLQVLREENQ